jgi:hypothetical protein
MYLFIITADKIYCSNKKFWEEPDRQFFFKRHGSHRKQRFQQLIDYYMCIICRGSVFTEPLPSSNKAFHIVTYLWLNSTIGFFDHFLLHSLVIRINDCLGLTPFYSALCSTDLNYIQFSSYIAYPNPRKYLLITETCSVTSWFPRIHLHGNMFVNAFPSNRSTATIYRQTDCWAWFMNCTVEGLKCHDVYTIFFMKIGLAVRKLIGEYADSMVFSKANFYFFQNEKRRLKVDLWERGFESVYWIIVAKNKI